MTNHLRGGDSREASEGEVSLDKGQIIEELTTRLDSLLRQNQAELLAVEAAEEKFRGESAKAIIAIKKYFEDNKDGLGRSRINSVDDLMRSKAFAESNQMTALLTADAAIVMQTQQLEALRARRAELRREREVYQVRRNEYLMLQGQNLESLDLDSLVAGVEADSSGLIPDRTVKANHSHPHSPIQTSLANRSAQILGKVEVLPVDLSLGAEIGKPALVRAWSEAVIHGLSDAKLLKQKAG